MAWLIRRSSILLFLAGLAFPSDLHSASSTTDSLHRMVSSEPGGLGGTQAPAWKYAPLLGFGVGALAVGGVIYGIGRYSDAPPNPVAPGRSTDVNLAIGLAALTALASGWAYFHYLAQDPESAVEGSAWVAPGPSGEPVIAALLRFRFPH